MAENTRNEEKPNDEDLRKKIPTTSSNQARDTVRGNIDDVVACINKAREAQEIAAHDLEKASNWLNKSQELLAEALAAIATGDAYRETQSGNPDAVLGNDDTNVNGLNPDTNPEQARTPNNYKEAETHNILEAEQLKMEVKLFPAKPNNDEKPSVTPSYAGVTVEGNPEDVVACVDKAKKAFAEKDLEKAKKWLIKSQRMLYNINAQELLNQVLAAIAAGDELKETPNVNTNAGPDDDDTNSIVDPNPEQIRTRTATKLPSGPTVHNDDVGAKKCLDNANKAFKAGDLDKAERLFLKAKRMDARIDVVQYLKLVHDGRARDITSRENAVSEEGPRVPEPPEQTNNNIDEANTYIQVAENAFKDKKYERVLMFLDKSEALCTSERAVKLRKQVQDAMSKPEKCTNYSTSEKLITAIRSDIDAGNLDEAERKLQTLGFVKAIQLKKLRRDVDEKKALRTREDKLKTAESNPKPVEQVEPPRNEKLNNIRADEADTCINVAEKAYNNGDLDKTERLLRKAERLYPTEKAKKALEIVCTAIKEKQRLDDEKLKCNENESATPPVEHTTEAIFHDDVQKLINSGLNDLEKQNYFSAEWSFKKAKQLQPSISKYVDELLTDVDTKVKKRNAIIGRNTFSIPSYIEGISTGTQNRQNEKPTNESDPIAAANKYTGWAQEAYNRGYIEHAESFLKLAEVHNSTERSRNLLVMVLRAKHGVDPSESVGNDVNTFVVVNQDKVIKEKGYLRSAEDAFIIGDFKEANNLMTKLEVVRSPYITELTEKIKILLRRNSHWYDKVKIF